MTIKECIKEIKRTENVRDQEIKEELRSTEDTRLRRKIIDCLNKYKVSETEIKEYIKEIIIKDNAMVGKIEIEGGLKDKKEPELKSELKDQILKEANRRIKELEFVGSGEYPFTRWVVIATIDVLEAQWYEVFYRTCEMISMEKKPRKEKLITLTFFVYSTDKEGVKIGTEWKDKMTRYKNIIYLTMVTKHKLIERTESETFERIKEMGGVGIVKEINMRHKMRVCKRVKENNKEYQECDNSDWSEIYSLMTDSEMKRVIEKIINK